MQDFVCWFMDEEYVYISKNRLHTKRGKTDYATFLEILGYYDKTLQVKYRISKLSEIAKKYGCTIITATQAQDASRRHSPLKDDYAPSCIFIDYLDLLKSY